MPSPVTPEVSLARRAAALSSWANTKDPTARTAPARAGLRERFRKQVDPTNELPPEERERRAEYAYKAHMAALAARSVKARRRKAEAAAP